MNLNYSVQMEPGAGCQFNCLFVCSFPSVEAAKAFFEEVTENLNEAGDPFMVTLRQLNKTTDRFELLAAPKTITGDKAFFLTAFRFLTKRRQGHKAESIPLVPYSELEKQMAEWTAVLDPNY